MTPLLVNDIFSVFIRAWGCEVSWFWTSFLNISRPPVATDPSYYCSNYYIVDLFVDKKVITSNTMIRPTETFFFT